jgi:tetratricopeptide (TPR) repeat protein
MDGQGAIAIQAGKDFAKLTDNNMYEALALIRFGRFEEVLELSNRPPGDIPGGIWDFTQGYAHLKVGNIGTARNYLENIKQTAEESETSYRGQKAEDLLGSVGFILEGEILREEKELTMAVEAFNKAVDAYDKLPYSEPETLPFSPRHWLGSVLLEMKEYNKAEKVYREQLEHHPNNGWSLYGLMQSMEGQDKQTKKIQKEFSDSWKRSDTWIPSANF